MNTIIKMFKVLSAKVFGSQADSYTNVPPPDATVMAALHRHEPWALHEYFKYTEAMRKNDADAFKIGGLNETLPTKILHAYRIILAALEARAAPTNNEEDNEDHPRLERA